MSSTENDGELSQADVKRLLGFEDTLLPEQTSAAAPVAGIFSLAHLDKSALAPSPIDPSWIVEGNPEARCRNLSRIADDWTVVDHWSCTAGKFRWHYGFDETILILEGEARITDDNGTLYHATPGTTLFFPNGSAANWHVPVYVRKVAFNQRHVPSVFHKALRAVSKLYRMAFRGLGASAPAR
ncbi:DUF861 domain-containing protein [Rhodobacterales bacterium]|nr:DUF861 domain-containing protein [Rhodobacterales bacterium]